MITIRSGYTITIGAAVNIDQVVVQSGGTLTINAGTLVNGAGTDLDVFGTVNGTAADTISAANTTIVVETNGSFDSSVGGDLTISGTLTVAGGTVTTGAHNLTGAGTLSILGGTVNAGNTAGAGGNDFKMTGTLTMSGGTLLIWHDFKGILPADVSCTGGTIEFKGKPGNAFVNSGTYHLFNVVVDSGVNPDFDHNAANVIAIAGSLTLNGATAVPFPTGNGSTAGALFFGTSQQVAGAWNGDGASPATQHNSTYLSGKGIVTVSFGGPDAVQSTLTPTSASITANGTSTQVLTVQAKDASGNNITIGSSTVTITKQSGTGTISAVTDVGNGTYTATVTSPTATGSGVFVATVGGSPVKSGTASQTQVTVTYTNVAPVATSPTVTRGKNTSLKIKISDLGTDANGDALSVTALGSGSQSATITHNTTYVFYVPSTGSTSNNNDSFTYTISDGTLTASGTVNVTVQSRGGAAQQITYNVNGVTVIFGGMPGLIYDVQRSTDAGFTSPSVISTIQAPTSGVFTNIDSSPSNPAFYRLIQH